ncbi:MAG: PucR family transcriptional regulator [Candidatus Limnocylindrales bacterium]
MPSIQTLWRAVFPSARPLGSMAERLAGAGHGSVARPGAEVAWVRVLHARVPALEGFERGDLAIVPDATLEALTGSGVEPAAVARALDQAGAVAALLLTRDPDSRAASALAEGEGLSLPVLWMEPVDAGALERSVIGYLVNARAELERQAGRLESEIEALALAGRGLEAQAAAVGTFLGRAVAVEGSRGQVLTAHAPLDRPAAASAAARYLRDPRVAACRITLPQVATPAQEERELRAMGALVILGEEPATELERAAGERVAALLALQIAAEAARSRRRAPGKEGLPAAGPPWVAIVARQGRDPAEDSSETRERMRDRLRRLAPARRLSLRGDASSLEIRLIAAVDVADPTGERFAARVATSLDRMVALSATFSEPGDRGLAESEARAALEAREALKNSGFDRIARVSHLPVYRLLGNLHHLPDGARSAPQLLAPLLVGGPAARRNRLATLRAILDHPSAADAARSLGIHRNTVAYRIARIEILTGWDLANPEFRLALSVALRLVQNDQENAGSQTVESP